MIKKGTWKDAVNVLKHVRGIKEVKEIALNVTFPTQDKYGKKSDMTVMKTDFKRQTIDKINFENFLTDNIPNVVDSYWESSAFSN